MATQDDINLLGICIYEEAGSEPYEGQVAVAKVIKNRMDQRFHSDGTVHGTVLAKDQFSWAYFGFTDGAYHRTGSTMADGEAAAQKAMASAGNHPALYSLCCSIAAGMLDGTLESDLPDDALNYVNLAISQPAWAKPELFIAKIGHHSFYRA